MTYLTTTTCLTEGCEGTPFYGETLSPGHCDDCHAVRMDAMSRIEELTRISQHADSSGVDEEINGYYEARDLLLSFGRTHPAAAPLVFSHLGRS